MKVYFFSKSTERKGSELRKVIESVVPNTNMEVFQTVKSLSHKLRHPDGNSIVAILLTSDTEDLKELISISGLLDDIRTILVLPNRDEDTISKGHLLFPRFMTYIDSDLEEVGFVLNRILRDNKPTFGGN